VTHVAGRAQGCPLITGVLSVSRRRRDDLAGSTGELGRGSREAVVRTMRLFVLGKPGQHFMIVGSSRRGLFDGRTVPVRV
jgi:hypothetical protein